MQSTRVLILFAIFVLCASKASETKIMRIVPWDEEREDQENELRGKFSYNNDDYFDYDDGEKDSGNIEEATTISTTIKHTAVPPKSGVSSVSDSITSFILPAALIALVSYIY